MYLKTVKIEQQLIRIIRYNVSYGIRLSFASTCEGAEKCLLLVRRAL